MIDPLLAPLPAQHNMLANRLPLATDDVTIGYTEGSLWYLPARQQWWRCVAAGLGVAIWLPMGALIYGTAITTDATPGRLTTDGAVAFANAAGSNTWALPNSAGFAGRVQIAARQSGGVAGSTSDRAYFELTFLARRTTSAANTAIVGSSGTSVAPLYSAAGAAGWRVGIVADTALGSIHLSVTGEIDKTIAWSVTGTRVDA